MRRGAVISGRVASNAAIQQMVGGDFQVVKTGTGLYKLSFPLVISAPVIIPSIFGAGSYGFAVHTGDGNIELRTQAGALIDAAFSFTAVW